MRTVVPTPTLPVPVNLFFCYRHDLFLLILTLKLPIIPNDTRLPIIPNDTRLPMIPNDTRLPIIPRDTRLPIIPTDTRLPIMPTDTRLPISSPRPCRPCRLAPRPLSPLPAAAAVGAKFCKVLEVCWRPGLSPYVAEASADWSAHPINLATPARIEWDVDSDCSFSCVGDDCGHRLPGRTSRKEAPNNLVANPSIASFTA